MKDKLMLILLLAFPLAVPAQNSRILYFMDLPQNRMLNPALSPPDSVNIALPASGFGFSFNNNFVNLPGFTARVKSDSLITFLHPDFNTDDFLNGIRRQNSLDTEFTVQMFGLGFNVGRTGYLFFDVNGRFQERIVIPGQLFDLVFKGNEPFAGDYVDLSSLKADLKFYYETGLGYSWSITKRLRAGIKGKLLLGVISASVANRSLGINIGEDYTHVFDADVSVNFSTPVSIVRNQEGNITDINSDLNDLDLFLLKGKKNFGTAFDAGITYSLTEKIVLSAAITDFGMIRWKREVTNLKSKNQFDFRGIDMTGVINGDQTFREAGEELLDSLNNAFSPVEFHEPFTTFLPASLNIGGSWRASKNFTFGILSGSRFMGRQIRESLTVSANVNLGSSLLASVSYTASNHRFDNFGAGLALRLSIFQFYVMSDMIPVSWNKIYTKDSNNSNRNFVLLPANMSTFDLRFGMNLVFGHRKKRAPVDCNLAEETGARESEDN